MLYGVESGTLFPQVKNIKPISQATEWPPPIVVVHKKGASRGTFKEEIDTADPELDPPVVGDRQYCRKRYRPKPPRLDINSVSLAFAKILKLIF